MRSGRYLVLIFVAFSLLSSGQTTFPVNGVANPEHNYTAFVNATIHATPELTFNRATLLIRDGLIKEVGKQVAIPKNTVVVDLKGKHIYPSFIDLYSDYGMPEIKKEPKSQGRSTQLFSHAKFSASWNEHVHPETEAVNDFSVNSKEAEEYRQIGFGTLLTHQKDGICRGTSALVLTGEEKVNEMIVAQKVAEQMAFKRGQSSQVYPSSLTGMIALIRQTYYDSEWYESRDIKEEEYNPSLEAIVKHKAIPKIIDATDGLSIARAAKIINEFGMEGIIRGTTDAYQYADEIKKSGLPLIIPVNFPKAYDISSPYEELDLRLDQLKHWELAPMNARILSEKGIPFVLTADGLKKKSNFLIAIRKIKKSGLSESSILNALTLLPARLIHQDELIGSLSRGKMANFLISTGNIFNENEIILENWVKGKKFVVRKEELDIRGNYNMTIGKDRFQLNITGKRFEPEAIIPDKNNKAKVKIDYSERVISLSFTLGEKSDKTLYRLDGIINDDESRIWAGKAVLQNGEWVDWAAIRQSDFENPKKDTSAAKIPPIPSIWFPNASYGFDSIPLTETIIFQNATIWTNEDTGILLNSDIAISEGKILAIGKNLSRVGLFGNKEVTVKIVNAKGKHITSGIIDEHSHIALSRGVNESGWNNSAEVRMGDVINPEDINIYRQLAGGVVAAQLLHGSANPIGGQSALIKLRWGSSAESMKIKDADGFIKFALGENVKQSNWGDHNKVRFPQTRMGVEQVYFDAFIRAKEYSETQTLYQKALENKKRKEVVTAPRRDLRLEAIAEILDTNRYITCHSYVQSEINMLMHVADSMKFRVNTFTHVLEGYKVADKLRKHGAAASTFSDWWAYKFEVNDAIPYNGALLLSQDVLTAFNSDDAEMGRRLNQEAAKAIKYGEVSEEEAWKLVTLNPAKMLHLDHKMGSLVKGKDADIVIWSENPLSVEAKVDQTYVDGRCLYDKNKNEQLLIRDRLERARIVKKMAASSDKSKDSQPSSGKKSEIYHCDTAETEM